MIVITLTSCPPALRGDLTKWLQEIDTGVYVGHVSARVREKLWKRVREFAKSGRATMAFSANNEQHMDFLVHNTAWEPIDVDGIKLMLHPNPQQANNSDELRTGFSNAAKMSKARQYARRTHAVRLLPEKYVVVDVETTGLSAADHEIIEIGALLVSERKIEAQFHALVKADTCIPPSIVALTGITDAILEKEGRRIEEVLAEFLKFAGEQPVVSHNANFDFSFLRYACEKCNLPLFSNQCIDTLSFARRMLDDVKNYKLTTLLMHFGIQADEVHRSMEDCLLTKQLYEKLIEMQQATE